MTDVANTSGPVLAADGMPLKRSLARSLRMQKVRALLLIAPLLLFVLVTFIAPIADMLFRSVENQIVSDTLPRTTEALKTWDEKSDRAPDDAVFEALYLDISMGAEKKIVTRLGSRLNYERVGASSLFRKSNRGVGRFDMDLYKDWIIEIAPEWEDPETWSRVVDQNRADLPLTAPLWDEYVAFFASKDKEIKKRDLEDFLFAALYFDNRASTNVTSEDPLLVKLRSAHETSPPDQVNLPQSFEKIDKNWVNPAFWQTLKAYTPPYTSGYFLNAVDMQKGPDGAEARPENQQIYMKLFGRTLYMSVVITLSCIALGYPVAWLLANLPMRTANLLMILVLLPFWTSLLVRTSAWKVMLQQQGVINDVLVWLGMVADDGRLVMINNQTGTIIAMTHILLPFMILPMYSVMQTIPPSYLRAAKSLGATNWTAFWRVYFPQTVPGIGAGSILVFILAIGYYITPAIVGGTTGVFISDRIAYHISSSLNWGLGAALGAILLGVVLILYWAYDRIVGIDNVKLGG